MPGSPPHNWNECSYQYKLITYIVKYLGKILSWQVECQTVSVEVTVPHNDFRGAATGLLAGSSFYNESLSGHD
jgi:hypothetical protein